MSKPERWSDYTHSCGCHQKSAECNQHFFDLVAPTKGNVKSIDVDELLIYFVGKKLTGVTFVKHFSKMGTGQGMNRAASKNMRGIAPAGQTKHVLLELLLVCVLWCKRARWVL